MPETPFTSHIILETTRFIYLFIFAC